MSFDVEQRLQEIGIRKILGASVAGILHLITKGYFRLVIASFVLASPLTYLIMDHWLEIFAYRVEWNPIYFVIGLAIIVIIVVLTISSKAIYAAQMNPSKTLRSE
jgi:putative ABC transport system permease protein